MWSSSSQKTRGFIVSQTSAVPSLYWKISFHMEHPYNTSAHFGIFVRNFCVNLVSIHSGQGVMAANLLVFTKRVMWPGSSQKTRGFIVSRTSDVPSSYWKISSHWDHPYIRSAHFGTFLDPPSHYSHISNKRWGWNKRGGVAKVAKSINVEVVIFLKNQ